ncbi:hypothetical protein [Roseinatronobacter sp.]|nr:hypothetical protein [Roseibaca sp.]
MRAIFLTLPAILALTACIEVDMNVEILGEDEGNRPIVTACLGSG